MSSDTSRLKLVRTLAKQLLALTGLVVAGLATATTEEPQAIHEWLTSYSEDLRVTQNLVGVSVAVTLADGRTIAATAGTQRADSDIPLSIDDRMLGGSTGKTYVAAIVMLLAEQGLVDLERTAASYLEDIPWYARVPNAETATIAQLLNHTAGIPHYIDDYGFLWSYVTDVWFGNDLAYTPEKMLSFVLDEEPTTVPGAEHHYSDLNYFALGLVIEAVTGKPYYENLAELILNPLSLEGSTPSVDRDIPRLVSGHAEASMLNRLIGAAGPTMEDGILNRTPAIEWTGGGLATTPSALARFYHALGSGRVVEADSLQRLMGDSAPVAPASTTRYGYGVYISEREGLGRYLSHAGWFPGYVSNVAYFEDGGFSVAIQVNQDGDVDIYTPIRDMATAVFDILGQSAEGITTHEFTLLSAGDEVGSQSVAYARDGSTNIHYEQRTQGKTPYVDVAVTVDESGLPKKMSRKGLAYLYYDIDESFQRTESRASWKSRSEQGSTQLTKPHYYVPFDLLDGGASAPAETALLAGALLNSKDRQLPLLPSGTARIESLGYHRLRDQLGSRSLQLVAITGLSLKPSYLWLDMQQRSFAELDGGVIVRRDAIDLLPDLQAAQQRAAQRYRSRKSEELLSQSIDTTKQPILVEMISIVNVRTGEAAPPRNVLVRDGVIERISAEPVATSETNLFRIDGRGTFLIPGLWDMHVHLDDKDRLLHLAGGVTTVRDLGNEVETLEALIKDIEEFRRPAPRIIKAGFIDKRGASQTPVGILVDSVAEATDAVDWYADRDYELIKLYGAIPGDWLRDIKTRTDKRGLHLVGHVPIDTNTASALDAGYDEVQHLVYLWLNFADEPVPRELTYSAARILARGDAPEIGQDALVDQFAANESALDPTLAIYETFLVADAGTPSPALAPFAHLLPTQTLRAATAGHLPVPDDLTEEDFNALFESSLQLIGKLHEAGVQLLTGTDYRVFPGLSMARELELLGASGISNGDVLRLATYDAAVLHGRDDRLGSIEEGKLADLVILASNPLADLDALRSPQWVFSRGSAYPTQALYRAVGLHEQTQHSTQRYVQDLQTPLQRLGFLGGHVAHPGCVH